MQISGGSADDNDIEDGRIDIFSTIIRECQEELGKFDKPKREYLKSLLELDSREIKPEEI